ncbi:MAG TPA: hypothetical protein VF203_00285 [Burkholderiales bacterium]
MQMLPFIVDSVPDTERKSRRWLAEKSDGALEQRQQELEQHNVQREEEYFDLIPTSA